MYSAKNWVTWRRIFRYLSLQATCPLGFSDRVRCAVEEAICDEVNGPHFDCFKPAVHVVLAFLRKHYLIPFFSSQHYVHLLSDMIRNSSSLANHSPTSSISEFSVESKQPLLNKLDPDTIWRRRKQRFVSPRHLCRVSAPSVRPIHSLFVSFSFHVNLFFSHCYGISSGLSFGRIDQFGRFQRDIEPDPGRNTGNSIVSPITTLSDHYGSLFRIV